MVIADMHCSRGPGLSWLADDGNYLPDLPFLIKQKTKNDEDATKVISKFVRDGINSFFTVLQGGKYHYFICDFKTIYNLHSYGV